MDFSFDQEKNECILVLSEDDVDLLASVLSSARKSLAEELEDARHDYYGELLRKSPEHERREIALEHLKKVADLGEDLLAALAQIQGIVFDQKIIKTESL